MDQSEYDEQMKIQQEQAAAFQAESDNQIHFFFQQVGLYGGQIDGVAFDGEYHEGDIYQLSEWVSCNSSKCDVYITTVQNDSVVATIQGGFLQDSPNQWLQSVINSAKLTTWNQPKK